MVSSMKQQIQILVEKVKVIARSVRAISYDGEVSLHLFIQSGRNEIYI